MAGRIAGITIELNGDSTKLTKALSDVGKAARQSQNNLKDINKLLKLDPGNTQLLQQKFSNLTTAIQGTKDKLEVLKDAQSQMEAKGLKGTEEWDALQREIAATEQQLKSLTQEMDRFGSVAAQQIAAAGQQVEAVGDKMTKVGTGMSKTVTAPIVAAGAASVAAWKEVDEGLDIIVTKTGATGAALEDMQNRAKNLATSIPTDFATAGAAIGEVNTRFGVTGKSLEDLSGKFIKFSSINNTDVSTSIDNVQTALAAFGLDVSQAGNMLDILNAAGQETGVSVDALASSLATNSTALREMGFNAADSAMFMANLEKNGVDSSVAVAGLRTALKNSTKAGQSMDQAIGELQTKIAGAKDKTEAMAIATELFGSKAGPALGAALYEGRLSLDELGLSLDSFAGSVENTFDETLDPMDQFKTALNELKIVGADLVSAAAPMIKSLAETIKTVISNIRSWWESLSPFAQQTIIKLAGIAAAVGPVLVVVGKLTSGVGKVMQLAPQIVTGIGKIKGVLTTLGGGLKALWGVLAANPIILVIAAVAALVAGFIYLWNHSEAFRNFWINLWENIKTVVSAAWDAIVSFLTSAWETISSTAQSVFSAIVDFLSTTWESIRTAAETAWNAIVNTVTTVWNTITSAVQTAVSAVSNAVSTAWNTINNTVTSIMSAIQGAISSAWSAISSTVSSVVSSIGSAISNGFNAAKNTVSNVLNDIKNTMSNIWDGAVNIVKGAVDKLKSLVNFQWSLPKIKLPHFSISGSFSLNPPSIPRISVEWYKKAMQDGLILNKPTVLPAADGTLRGYGDAGPEAVVGVSSLRAMIGEAVAAAGGMGGNITIPVYIGQRRIETIVVDAIQRNNYRSGGR